MSAMDDEVCRYPTPTGGYVHLFRDWTALAWFTRRVGPDGFATEIEIKDPRAARDHYLLACECGTIFGTFR